MIVPYTFLKQFCDSTSRVRCLSDLLSKGLRARNPPTGAIDGLLITLLKWNKLNYQWQKPKLFYFFHITTLIICQDIRLNYDKRSTFMLLYNVFTSLTLGWSTKTSKLSRLSLGCKFLFTSGKQITSDATEAPLRVNFIHLCCH